jgi:hypothetical protein
MRCLLFVFLCWSGLVFAESEMVRVPKWPKVPSANQKFDVVVLSGTPAGIMAAISAAREGKKVVIVEREKHIGGLPANGLGATDIATRGVTGGLFLEFVNQVKQYYITKYGDTSKQVKDCSDGYHFEPHVAEKVFLKMLADQPSIQVVYQIQFDALTKNVLLNDGRILAVALTKRNKRKYQYFYGKQFIDASYEGDLAAASGVRFKVGRESREEFGEAMAGRIYKAWGGEVGAGSTYEGDTAIQAYNYRMCITDNASNLFPITKPPHYDRGKYLSLIDDVKSGWVKGMIHKKSGVMNPVRLPNRKYDANNHHFSLLSTDWPEENWWYPKATWKWRDEFAIRLKNYTLGLLWFAQHDTTLPLSFRLDCLRYGLCKDEYADNNHFPRQVYVREARRIEGEHFFTAHDALPAPDSERPPVHQTSVTASHYAIDSHAMRKREPNRVHLDGFISYHTKPYTVPYGVMVPRSSENLLVPVCVSASHVGLGTLRMEPCWMALGQAAGMAASIAIDDLQPVSRIAVTKLQSKLLDKQAVLVYVKNINPSHPDYKLIQQAVLKLGISQYELDLDKHIPEKILMAAEPFIPDHLASELAEKAPNMTLIEFFRTISKHF